MAEEKKAKKRSLDYSLPAGTLAALQQAQQAKLATKGSGSVWGKALSNIGAQASLRGKEIQAEKDLEEEEEKLELEAQKFIDDTAEIAYDNSWHNTEAGNWTNAEQFKHLNNLEEGFKEEYLNLLNEGDKVGANGLINEQSSRYSNLTAWQESVLFAAKIYSKDKGSKHLEFSATMSADDKAILTKINEQGADVKIDWDDDTKEYVFKIDGMDEPISLKRYNKITNNLVPKDFSAKWGTDQNAIYKSVMDGKMTKFNGATYFSENSNKIDKDNIQKLYRDKVFMNRGGKSFADDIKLHPDFELENLQELMVTSEGTMDLAIPKGMSLDADLDQGNEDGYLNADEIENLSEDDKDKIVDLLLLEDDNGNLLNFELAQAYLAEYMTSMQNGQFIASVGERDKEAKRKHDL